MNYTITRDGQQYGPYTLSDLQRYVASGEILLSDLAIGEGMSDAVPVSQIIGNIAVPPPVAVAQEDPALAYPNPPNLHWGWVLGISVLTRWAFVFIWGIVLAVWMKKVAPQSKAIYYYIASAACIVVVILGVMAMGLMLTGASSFHGGNGLIFLTGLTFVASVVLDIIARFSLRGSMEDHYNNIEGIPLTLNGVFVFFGSSIYLQYHVNEIVKAKKAMETAAGLARY